MKATAKQNPPITMWKIVVLGVCLCVFLFGLQAKLAQYQAPSPHVAEVTAAKLWDSERLELKNLLALAQLLTLGILLFSRDLLVEVQAPLPALELPAPVPLSRLRHLQRFFRPPPAL